MKETELFFSRYPEALPLYEALKARILTEIDDVRIKVQKTQITFWNRHVFACVSFLRLRKKDDLPPVLLIVTFGLPQRAASARIEAAVEPYPGRWTHHVLVSGEEDIDGELMGWLRAAAAFSRMKR